MSTSPKTASRVGVDVGLLAILALALLFRLYRIDALLVDGHSWRQVTNADIARHFATTTWNLFTPQVSWGGVNGVVGMEFPLLQYVIGMTWRTFGESEMIARLLAVAFSMTSVLLIFLLGRDLFSIGAGRGAAFLLAVAPSTVFFGRSVLSDTPMVTFSIAAVLAWHRALSNPSRSRTVLATVFTALSGLVKLPAVIVGLPIVALAWKHRGVTMLRDRSIWIGGAASVAMIVGWYWYSDAIAARTGLTQAVFRPSGIYGPELGLPMSAYATVSHWSTTARLRDPGFLTEMMDRFWFLHLTPFGFGGALFGWWLARGERYALVIDAWMAGGVALLFGTAEGQIWHQFHQLPMIPPLALYFGIAAAPLFDARTFRTGLVRRAGIAACFAAMAWLTFRTSAVQRGLYRPDNMQVQFPTIGGEIRSTTQPNGLMLTIDYDNAGANSPMLLFYAHRQGWSFDVHAIQASVVQVLRERYGLRYLVTFQWSALNEQKPELVQYLAGFKRMGLETANSQVRMYDLTQPIPVGAQ